MASGENPTPTYTNQGAFEGMTSLTNKTFATNNVTELGLKLLKVAQYSSILEGRVINHYDLSIR